MNVREDMVETAGANGGPTESCGPAPVLLDDEQVREYIANGYVRIETSVAPEVHATIAHKLDEMIAQGPNLGNNVLPRVPEFRHVLHSPEVRGALISLLGEDYIEHPHRYCHDSKPKDEKPEDIAAAVAGAAHQDGYTPMGNPRQHYSRLARIIYYPQDTPIELGPTHVTPGTPYHQSITDEDRSSAIPMVGPAGSLWITHFDVVHAAGVNVTDRVRHMIKFIYVRRTEPMAPSWHCEDDRWRSPERLLCPWDMEIAWSHFWDWMSGKRNRYESFFALHSNPARGDLGGLVETVTQGEHLDAQLGAVRQLAALGSEADGAVPALSDKLNKDHQAARAAAIYALGAIGETAVGPLIERLEAAGRRGWEDGGLTGWNENAVTMMDEAHALAAVGAPAVGALVEILETAGEWSRLNAAFALGEMDSHAGDAAPALTRCLDDESHRIVRTALAALGTIGERASCAVPRMSRLLSESRPEWEEVAPGRRIRMARDQVRVSAAAAAARLGPQAGAAEEALVGALDDPCGYVGLYATDALLHLGSSSARQAATDFVMAQRWDPSLLSETNPW